MGLCGNDVIRTAPFCNGEKPNGSKSMLLLGISASFCKVSVKSGR